MKALVVDDSDACRRALADLVAAAGFDVVGTAASGEEACREVERLRPDLVLLDVRMPGMDGFETARAIEESGSGAVVVLISASSLLHGPASDYVVSKSALTPALLRELWRIRAPAA